MFDGHKPYEYHRCRGCGASYQHPMPKPDMISSFYPDSYRIYDVDVIIKKHRTLEKAVLRQKYGYRHLQVPRFYRVIASFIAPFFYRNAIRYSPPGKALDVGCGNGQLLHRLKDIGWDCEGVEFNKGAVETCRSHGLKVTHGDLESAKFEDASFDLITASHVIEHVPDLHSFMKEIARLLKRGGQALIRTPNNEALGRKWFGSHWYADDVPRHLFHLSVANLDMIASRNNLSRVKLKLNTTPKNILNSVDYKTANKGRPSKKRRLRRFVAKIYVFMATLLGRGDEIYVIYEKT